ncbi:MAG: hypothetical protein ABEJ68_04855 [Halobacteriaceae archaeon]
MTANTGDGDDPQTRTTIEVDRQVWRELRSDAVADGLTVSEQLERVLEDYYDVDD